MAKIMQKTTMAIKYFSIDKKDKQKRKLLKQELITFSLNSMQSPKSFTHTLQPSQQKILMKSFISTVIQSQLEDTSLLNQSLLEMDNTLSKMYAKQHYDPQMVLNETIKSINKQERLKVPKSSTLTDALIRNTLGCDEKYAKQYMKLIDQVSEQKQKQDRIQKIKQSFTSSNKFNDPFANSKPFFGNGTNTSTLKPVVDNQHEGYLKTQLIFLEKPTNKNITKKQYYQKYYDTITKKIDELGGMDDTLSKMQNTLKNNELKSVKSRQFLRNNSIDQKKKDPIKINESNLSNRSTLNEKSSWTLKSKHMRQQLNKMINQH